MKAKSASESSPESKRVRGVLFCIWGAVAVLPVSQGSQQDSDSLRFLCWVPGLWKFQNPIIAQHRGWVSREIQYMCCFQAAVVAAALCGIAGEDPEDSCGIIDGE